MYKILIYSAALCINMQLTASIGSSLIKHSPSNYLVDLALYLNTSNATFLIGQELLHRNYLGTISTSDCECGSYDERPTDAPSGHTLDEGIWLWIPSSAGATAGTWYWMLRSYSAYMQWWHDHVDMAS